MNDWPIVCPTGQAGPIASRLPRHCTACVSQEPPQGCAFPAYSPYWRALLVADYVRLLGRASEAAHATVNESERKRLVKYGRLPLASAGAPIQLGLFGGL